MYREPAFNIQSGPSLRFSNTMTDLGNFRSFVSHNDTSKMLHIGITFDSVMERSNYSLLDPAMFASLDIDSTTPEEDDEQEPPSHMPYKFDADFYFGVRQNLISIGDPSQSPELALKAQDSDEDSANEHRAILRHATFCVRSFNGERLLFFELVARTSSGSISKPEYYLRLTRDFLDTATDLSSSDVISDSDPTHVLLRVVMPGLFPERIFGRMRLGADAQEELGQRYWPLPPFMDEAFNDLRSAVSRIFYLGPLRAPAKRYYPIQADSSSQNDVSGELLPILLRDRMNSTVVSAAPKTHHLVRLRLFDAVNWWLHFMRTGNSDRPAAIEKEFKIESLQDVLVEMQVRGSVGRATHSLADSGFGYSQLLPILVRGLILPSGQTLLIEQPEVHLNPALQVRLSDFFVAMSSVGKQIIIETHSEHIVNSIRAISAEKATPNTPSQCTVLYIEADKGRPKLHKLNVLSDGTIPEVPQSFFGEAAQVLGRILRAQRKSQ